MRVIQEGGLPIKMWLEDIEDGTLQQAINLSKLPFAYKHIAIMPDAHYGYGMCIGGVLATKGVIIPNAAGVDIGCGMCAVKTNLQIEGVSSTNLKTIIGDIRKRIPVGFNKHNKAQNEILMPIENLIKTVGSSNIYGQRYDTYQPTIDKYPICYQEYNNALKSLGTLGGGNHFIEMQKDEEGLLWIMIHSGSRNLGYKVAEYYNKVAIDLNEKYYSQVPKNWELAFLLLDSEEGRKYLAEMNYCVAYAFANRKLMMDRVKEIVLDISSVVEFKSVINIAHNYAAMETHFGEDVMVHRKGATRARKGEIGIIPGSQGSASFIVQGLGNPESYKSCSHGAGRQMSRKKARAELSLEDEQAKMVGIIHSVRGRKNLDEAPGAYKDIDLVMEQQKDLVEIVTRLEPLVVLKG